MPVTVHEVARALPDPEALRRRCRALALAEAILSPDQESRYYRYDAHWGPGAELASMDNGSGDAYSIVFTAVGTFIRGFDHESQMSPAVNDGEVWPGVVDQVPEVFADQVDEPAFSFDDTIEATCCLWRQVADDRWHAGEIDFPDGIDPDCALGLFGVLLDPTPATYRGFAEDYYELDVDPGALTEIYAARPLTEELVRRLNPELSLADLADDLDAMGQPLRSV
ncbi:MULTISPECIES: hypothetical protein [unclassified Micromonospora]|uniref:hypothetical protein n=1 Tax=unclassified Micromonospora TaxID=2617518 RepID=UPI002FF40B73